MSDLLDDAAVLVENQTRAALSWGRSLPARSAVALARSTGLPPGFWYVLAMAAATGAASAVVVVTLVWNQAQDRPPLPVENRGR